MLVEEKFTSLIRLPTLFLDCVLSFAFTPYQPVKKTLSPSSNKVAIEKADGIRAMKYCFCKKIIMSECWEV